MPNDRTELRDPRSRGFDINLSSFTIIFKSTRSTSISLPIIYDFLEIIVSVLGMTCIETREWDKMYSLTSNQSNLQ